jgi:hypothetical protein
MSLDVYLREPEKREELFWKNITHNLGKMADEAGIYKHLWRPDEIGITKASQLIEPLKQGLKKLRENPEHFMQFNPANGWGSYDGLLAFVSQYLRACEDYPDANIDVSR